MGWLANNTDGWIWHLSNDKRLPELIQQWRAARMDDGFRPHGHGTFFELAKDPDAPMRCMISIHGIHTTCIPLISLRKQQQDQGISHVVPNLKPNRRPAKEILREPREYVLPHFPGE